MNRKLATIIALEAFLIVVLFWVLVFYGKDEYEAYVQGEIEEEIETPNRISTSEGMTIVTLPKAAQEQSGIETLRLESSKHLNTLSTYGTVVNIDSLIEQRNRYLTAKAEAGVAKASLANTQQEFTRLSALNQDNKNVSDRAVAGAEAALKADQAKLNAAENITRNLHDSIGQQWGEALASQAIQSSDSSAFNRIMQYRDVLIQATLPFDAPSPQAGSTITVSPAGSASGSSAQAVEAQFVSPSPQTDMAIQGKTFYYRAPANTLRVGMRVSIKLKDNEQHAEGVIVPNSAIVWYGGQAWAYRQDTNDRFKRVHVRTENESDGGWFTHAGLKAGDEVVITGAQLLLSEEFKYQITNENDD
jgi:multidrug efflux pump subunit AcrA (membrane-fusion protein)